MKLKAAILSCLLASPLAKAESVTVVPYLSIGLYWRDCALTDALICDNDKMGSDNPTTIDYGLRLKPDYPMWWLLWADEVDVGGHHQSYYNRGYLLWYDFGGEEAQYDMYGVKWTWEFNTYSFRF